MALAADNDTKGRRLRAMCDSIPVERTPFPHPCRVIAVLGTRPEAIKLAHVIDELRLRPAQFETAVVNTGQHRTMIDHFKIKPEFDIDVMRPDQSMSMLLCRVIDAVENACDRFKPDIILVQGDTTTAFGASLAAYYSNIPIAHVEAGLRSYDIHNPFPEEANRRFISVVAEIHFAPSPLSRDALLAEGIPAAKIVVTGNTVVDTLLGLSQLAHSWENTPLAGIPVDGKRIVLVTSHRRESWGTDQENLCRALVDLVSRHPDIRVIYPVHMNPNVRHTINALLTGIDRIHLTEPLDYVTFVSLLRRCFLVLTDSGGVQEEAPTFHKPVLVLRTVTERPEATQFGMAKLIGMSRERIIRETERLLDDPQEYVRMSEGNNPFGDGQASQRIVDTLTRWHSGTMPLLDPHNEFTPLPRRLTPHLKSGTWEEPAVKVPEKIQPEAAVH